MDFVDYSPHPNAFGRFVNGLVAEKYSVFFGLSFLSVFLFGQFVLASVYFQESVAIVNTVVVLFFLFGSKTLTPGGFRLFVIMIATTLGYVQGPLAGVQLILAAVPTITAFWFAIALATEAHQRCSAIECHPFDYVKEMSETLPARLGCALEMALVTVVGQVKDQETELAVIESIVLVSPLFILRLDPSLRPELIM